MSVSDKQQAYEAIPKRLTAIFIKFFNDRLKYNISMKEKKIQLMRAESMDNYIKGVI